MKAGLLAFCSCLIALTALAWGISFVDREFLHLGFPFDTPLYDPGVHFSDLTDFYVRVHHLAAGGSVLDDPRVPFNYLPFALYVYAFFILSFKHPVIAMTSFVACALIAALLVLRASLDKSTVSARWINVSLIVTALCSYPFMFAADRANLEEVIWVFAFWGLVFFVRKQYLLSALFFAVAVCIKPFPALYFLLFLRPRLYKEIAMAFAVVCAVSFVFLRAIGPTIPIAYHALETGVRKYQSIYVTSFRSREIGFDHSLLSCIKQVIRLARGWPPTDSLHGVLTTTYAIWMPIAGLIFIACAIFFRNKPVLNQLFAIVLLKLILPPMSGDYTLVDIYLPWGVFMIFLIGDVGRGRIDFPLKNCLWVLIPCAVVMTPQSYLTLAGGGFAGQVKALVMVFLLYVAARVDMPASLFGELPASPSGRKAADNNFRD